MRKSKGCLYWLLVGWWYTPIKFMESFILKLVIYGICIGIIVCFSLPVAFIAIIFSVLLGIFRFFTGKIRKYGNIDFDKMNGHKFEQFCADILRDNGFYNVRVTKGSGDHGVDILANKGWKKYAIQCKCYSKNVGNRAVQEVYSGKTIYKADKAVVFTNNYFTKQAKEDAEKLGVELWDRDKLLKFVNKPKKNFRKKVKEKNLQNNIVSEKINKKEEVLTIEGTKYSHVNNYVEESEKDDLFADAGRFIIEQGEVSPERLQRNFLLGNKNDIEVQKAKKHINKNQLEEYMELSREEYELKRELDFLKKQRDEYIIVKNSNEKIREVALEIYKTFLYYGVEIKFNDIELEIGNVIYKFVPLNSVRVKTILSYKPEISLALGNEIDMKLLAEKGCIGLFVPNDYIIRKRNENEKEKI